MPGGDDADEQLAVRGIEQPPSDEWTTGEKVRRVAFSLTLALVWLFISGAFVFFIAFLSFVPVPFALGSLVAFADRVSVRLTRHGDWAVGVAAVGVALVTVFALAEVGRGGGYVWVCLLSAACSVVVALDINDRYRTVHPY